MVISLQPILEDSFLNKLSVDFDDWMFLVENNVLMNHADSRSLVFKLEQLSSLLKNPMGRFNEPINLLKIGRY